MALLLRDTLEIEFWEFDKGYTWRDGSGHKLFTINNALHHNFERDISKEKGTFYIGNAILSTDMFNGYFNLEMETKYHLTIKALAWNTDSEKSTPIMIYIPFAKIVKMSYQSTPQRIIETDILMEISYGIKVSGDKKDVDKIKIEMVAVEEEE